VSVGVPRVVNRIGRRGTHLHVTAFNQALGAISYPTRWMARGNTPWLRSPIFVVPQVADSRHSIFVTFDTARSQVCGQWVSGRDILKHLVSTARNQVIQVFGASSGRLPSLRRLRATNRIRRSQCGRPGQRKGLWRTRRHCAPSGSPGHVYAARRRWHRAPNRSRNEFRRAERACVRPTRNLSNGEMAALERQDLRMVFLRWG